MEHGAVAVYKVEHEVAPRAVLQYLSRTMCCRLLENGDFHPTWHYARFLAPAEERRQSDEYHECHLHREMSFMPSLHSVLELGYNMWWKIECQYRMMLVNYRK